LVLSGAIIVSATPFFWGGCLACSFIFSFFMTSCLMVPSEQV
jgi:predicted permease